jgi:hypothetical protein
MGYEDLSGLVYKTDTLRNVLQRAVEMENRDGISYTTVSGIDLNVVYPAMISYCMWTMGFQTRVRKNTRTLGHV